MILAFLGLGVMPKIEPGGVGGDFDAVGHRIELGEIEANVNTLDGIYLSCAVYNKQKDRIVLYYTGTIEEGELKDVLTEKVPRYMLPATFNKLDDMPLTPNGKVDRKKLLEMAK